MNTDQKGTKTMEIKELIEELEILIEEAEMQQRHIRNANYDSPWRKFEAYANESAIIVAADDLIEALKERNN